MSESHVPNLFVAYDADGRIDQDLPCQQCGYNLRARREDDQCPQCGENVHDSAAFAGRLALADAAERRRRRPGFRTQCSLASRGRLLAVVYDADGQIDQDLPCVGCGYNLRTRTDDQPCPECGKSVFESAQLAGLRRYDPDSKRKRLMWVAILIGIAVLFVVLCFTVLASRGILPWNLFRIF